MSGERCTIPNRHGSRHCAHCLVGLFVLREGEVCPNGVRLEDLPLAVARVRAGRCLSCAEKERARRLTTGG